MKKLDLKLPFGLEVHYEKDRMSYDRFIALLICIGALGGGALFVLLLTSKTIFG